MSWHLAQVNVQRLREPLYSPGMASFIRSVADVNWLADQSPGFVWRHEAPAGEPVTMGELAGTGPVVVTLSVWDDFAALQQYVYRTAHGLFMRRRAQWFDPIPGFTTALWWVPEGCRPTIAEGLGRLVRLRTAGPTPEAFSLRHQFEPVP